MLVLSRRNDESICIGNCITVTVVDIRGDKVRLGVTAPRSIPVHRDEIAAKQPPAIPDDEVYQGVLSACGPIGPGAVRPRLPNVPLERMLAVHASRPRDAVVCDPRLIAAVYALQHFGGIERLTEALESRDLQDVR